MSIIDWDNVRVNSNPISTPGRPKIDVSKEKLEKLYFEDGLSQRKIAIVLDVSENTIRRRFRDFGITSESNRYSTRTGNVMNINLSPTPNLFYLLGCLKGDGWVSKCKGVHSYSYEIGMGVCSDDFAKSFYNALVEVGLNPRVDIREVSGNRNDIVRVKAFSKVFCDWYLGLSLKDVADMLNELSDSDFIESVRLFLRGFYESEGSFYRGEYSPDVAMFNTNKELISFVDYLVNLHGWKTTVSVNGGGCYRLRIRGSTSEKLSFIEWLNPVTKLPTTMEEK